MQKAIVSYPHKNETTIEVERFLIGSVDDMQSYFEKFPQYNIKTLKDIFRRELNDGNTIIVNNVGGWCIETSEIKIIQYL